MKNTKIIFIHCSLFFSFLFSLSNFAFHQNEKLKSIIEEFQKTQKDQDSGKSLYFFVYSICEDDLERATELLIVSENVNDLMKDHPNRKVVKRRDHYIEGKPFIIKANTQFFKKKPFGKKICSVNEENPIFTPSKDVVIVGGILFSDYRNKKSIPAEKMPYNLKEIVVFPDFQNGGLGTKAMNNLLQLSEKFSIGDSQYDKLNFQAMYVKPKPDEKIMKFAKRLVFYSKFGAKLDPRTVQFIKQLSVRTMIEKWNLYYFKEYIKDYLHDYIPGLKKKIEQINEEDLKNIRATLLADTDFAAYSEDALIQLAEKDCELSETCITHRCYYDVGIGDNENDYDKVFPFLFLMHLESNSEKRKIAIKEREELTKIRANEQAVALLGKHIPVDWKVTTDQGPETYIINQEQAELNHKLIKIIKELLNSKTPQDIQKRKRGRPPTAENPHKKSRMN